MTTKNPDAHVKVDDRRQLDHQIKLTDGRVVDILTDEDIAGLFSHAKRSGGTLSIGMERGGVFIMNPDHIVSIWARPPAAQVKQKQEEAPDEA